jgi:hypothetical protein
MCVLKGSAPFSQVASSAGCYEIAPFMPTAFMLGDDMVEGQIRTSLTAILTSEAIPAKDLPLREPHLRSRSFHHVA